ncbi:hypothetical protein NMY22_g347 [Coprinellus aureogranulatus]|nr:hypothetical protein NMY22_g347 [Coprinellus aureogranulatus]
MDGDDDWNRLLKDHPIFSPKRKLPDFTQDSLTLELSSNTLPKFLQADPRHDDPTPSGRRQTMVLKDADLVVAVGKELRIASLGDIKLGRSARKSYKASNPSLCLASLILTGWPALNPNGKLLAVAGARQVAVVVMPRAGYSRLIPDLVECKAVHVGQFYHASEDSSPVAKIDWHPWGEAGSTLLIMTIDGKFREYDISVDTEEPQQVLSFVPPKKSSFAVEDESEREVTSFTLGKGRADWGPLTVYALMKSGDIYSVCPYLPQNAAIPTAYVHSLECFISAKQEYLSQESSSSDSRLSTLYDYQSKYVNSLIKQLPAGSVFPATTRFASVHPPKTIRNAVLRQGPFLLQPVPRSLDGSDGGDATDIMYLSFGNDDQEAEDEGKETDHLGVLVVSYQDGKVDVFLDVEKVEGRWENKHMRKNELPMLAVYESIDLGLISQLIQPSVTPKRPSLLELLHGNHPTFLADPIHDDVVYVYHAFGVHALDLSPVLENLSQALRMDDEDTEAVQATLSQGAQTNVRPILTTFSVERKGSNPIIGIAVPNDVYLTYSIFMLTSTLRVTVLPLNLQVESAKAQLKQVANLHESTTKALAKHEQAVWLQPVEGPSPYVSLLGEPFTPHSLLRGSGLPPLPKLSLPSGSASKEFTLTPDTLRYIGKIVEQITGQIHELHVAQRAAEARVKLQQEELNRQVAKCREMEQTLARLKQAASQSVGSGSRLARMEETQKGLMKRFDRLLQSLMAKASPELSEQEQKWFEELKRMKAEILGQGQYDEGAIRTRVKLLEREYARILPALKALAEKEKAKQQKDEVNRNLGFSQAFEYGKRSNEDAKRISKIENEIVRLAEKLDLNLPRPPPTELSQSTAATLAPQRLHRSAPFMDSANRLPVDETGKPCVYVSPPASSSPPSSSMVAIRRPQREDLYTCLACDDRKLFEKKNRGQHERGEFHKYKADMRALRLSRPLVPVNEDTPNQRLMVNAARHLVRGVARRRDENLTPLEPAPAPIPYNWGLEELEELQPYPTAEEEAIARARERVADLEDVGACPFRTAQWSSIF